MLINQNLQKKDVTNLKSDVNKLDVEKLKGVDLSKLNDVVKTILLKILYMLNWFKGQCY